jgi:hypothetical protein
VQEIEELKQQGLSIKAISKLTGYDRKTIRKYRTSDKFRGWSKCIPGHARFRRAGPVVRRRILVDVGCEVSKGPSIFWPSLSRDGSRVSEFSSKNGFRLPKFTFKRKERLGAANPLGVKIVIDWTELDVYFQPPEIQKTNSGR